MPTTRAARDDPKLRLLNPCQPLSRQNGLKRLAGGQACEVQGCHDAVDGAGSGCSLKFLLQHREDVHVAAVHAIYTTTTDATSIFEPAALAKHNCHNFGGVPLVWRVPKTFGGCTSI